VFECNIPSSRYSVGMTVTNVFTNETPVSELDEPAGSQPERQVEIDAHNEWGELAAQIIWPWDSSSMSRTITNRGPRVVRSENPARELATQREQRVKE
jgi:hypothetical protein